MTGVPEAEAESPAELAERATHEERLGHWDASAGLFARAFRVALLSGSVEGAVDALRGQARVRRNQGRYGEAEELAVLSREISERHGLPRSAARAVNVLALVRYAQQDWSGAKELYEQALEMALETGDDELIGLTCLNLGVVANMQGDFRGARVRYLESIGSAVRSGNKQNELMAYNNLGLVCSDMRDWMEAEVYFSRGIEISERIGDTPQTARLFMNRAEPLIHTGETERARETLDRAETIAERIHDAEVLADIARFRGMASRIDGEWDEAGRQLSLSLALTQDAGLEMGHGETLMEVASLRMDQGKPGEARGSLLEARTIFERLGAERDTRKADELLAALEEKEREAPRRA